MANIYQTHNPGSTDSLYLKLKSGDRVKLRIITEPAVSTFDGKKLRYNWVVWNRELNKPQVYGAGISVFSQIADLVEEWGTPEGYDITIKRSGSGPLDTEYSVTPVKNSDELTTAQLAEAEKIDLPQACKGKWLTDFEEDGEMPEAIKPGGNVSEENTPPPSDEDAPININEIPFA